MGADKPDLGPVDRVMQLVFGFVVVVVASVEQLRDFLVYPLLVCLALCLQLLVLGQLHSLREELVNIVLQAGQLHAQNAQRSRCTAIRQQLWIGWSVHIYLAGSQYVSAGTRGSPISGLVLFAATIHCEPLLRDIGRCVQGGRRDHGEINRVYIVLAILSKILQCIRLAHVV